MEKTSTSSSSSYFPSISLLTKQSSSLPISKQEKAPNSTLRKRIPSFSSITSTTIQQVHLSSSAASAWAIHCRSKLSSSTNSLRSVAGGGFGFNIAGSSSSSLIRKWWELGCGWVLSRKPSFASDLEMDEHDYIALGSHNRGTLRHVLCKAKNQLRRLVVGSDHYVLPN